MTRRELLGSAAATMLSPGAASAQELPPLLVRDPIRNRGFRKATLAERMTYYRVPGVAVALIENSQIAWVRHYGVVEAGKKRPVTAQTLFQAGSISKPVAATAALRLVEPGKLELDRDVNEYLKSWKVPANGSWQPQVTIRQLVSHTAGLTVHGFPGYPRSQPLASLLNVLNGRLPANTAPIVVDTVPGTQMRYSGGGYCVLQQLLIDVMGKPFPALMRELVLDPAGMARSSYEQPLPEPRARFAATGHRGTGDKVEGGNHIYPEMAAAGLWTTPEDLATFVIELQKARQGRPSKLLSEKMAKEMMAPQVEEHIGLGVFLSGKGDNQRFGHGGWDEGFVAEVTAYATKGHGAAVMTNSDAGGSALNPEILSGLAQEYNWPEYLPAEKTRAMVAVESLDAYAGKYELRPGVALVVERLGSQLQCWVPGQAAVEFEPESKTKFYSKFVNAELTFARSGNGPAESLTFAQNGRTIAAKRL
jgi:CubicO group peptidase (beta-lactamase class C family)